MPALENCRKYGRSPFSVAVIHGGPGAAGSVASVAKELSKSRGVLEPLQTASTIDGQAMELHDLLQKNATLPVTLIGHSWGAWLGLIFAARNPFLVKKLILVGCGPMEEKYSEAIIATRLSRLNEEEVKSVLKLTSALNDPSSGNKDAKFGEFGRLMSIADSYDLLPGPEPDLVLNEDINRNVWNEAEVLRSRGELLRIAGNVRCPIVAIHGDYDPHPSEGVEKPLSKHAKDFRFILLKKCGHEPWRERFARAKFFEALEKELA